MKGRYWKGQFSFDPESPEFLRNKIISCELVLDHDGAGGISGSLMDSEFQQISSAEIKLTGFIEEDFISLVAVYPTYRYFDEQGKMYLDNEQPGQEMAFYGNLDETGEIIHGTWEVSEKTYLHANGVGDYVSMGIFEIRSNS